MWYTSAEFDLSSCRPLATPIGRLRCLFHPVYFLLCKKAHTSFRSINALAISAHSRKKRRKLVFVSLARPSHSAAFSSFRINTRREGLAHCLYPFGSSPPRCWLANQIQGKCDYVTFKFSARMPSRTGTVVGRITYCLGFSFSLKTTTEARLV